MKFSESWLRESVNPPIETAILVEQLTMAGLEVDAVEPVAGEFTGLVVGEIIGIETHPNADKLRVCQVASDESTTLTVVCGAPNARVGLKVPYAKVGATLPGGVKIKKAKLRGVESKGMLCGQTELEAGDDDSGLWELAADAPVGTDLRDYLQLDDIIIDVDLTPNRSDCLGIEGIAREVAALNRIDRSSMPLCQVTVQSKEEIDVSLAAPQACPRYIGRVIEGINAATSSPFWLQEKLRRSGIRPIDAIVDITNYVLMELGQPLHAFDREKIDTHIIVRHAEDGEKLTLLNDQTIELTADSLVIADTSRVLALAGVMGGSASAVSDTTTTVFLESAYFDPIAIAGKARHYGLHTDASHRFERGVDFELAERAIERASELILAICGGQAGPLVRAESDKHLPKTRNVVLLKSNITTRLGFSIDESDVEDILSRLGLVLTKSDSKGWVFSIPSYRFDISIEADLLEELARVYGYNNLPTSVCMIPQSLPVKSEKRLTKETFCLHLVARDFQEVITYSFIDPELHTLLFGEVAPLPLMNPISQELSVMRASLIPGLLETLGRNLKRQHSRVRLFETGQSFAKANDSLEQKERIAGLIYGQRDGLAWLSEKNSVDFYDIKGDVESLVARCGAKTSEKLEFVPKAACPFLHPGQSADVVLAGETIGYLGAIHPKVQKQLGHSKSVFVFELTLSALLKTTIPSYAPISRYPEVERDLAFLVENDVPVATLTKAIKSAAGENMKQLKVFDIYSGEGIDSERKSVAFHLTFQHSSRTLNEDEVNSAVNAVMQKLKGNFDAILR